MKRVVGSLLVTVLAAVVLVGWANATSGSPSSNDSLTLCKADMAAQSKTLTFPAPTRLKKSFDLFGYRFEPVPASFVPRASPNLAWTGFANEWETHAYHHVYLAYFVDLAAQQANAHGLPSQDVWVAVIHHDAYQPSAGPRGTARVPSCVFGSAITVINAFTGKGVVGAG